MTADADPIKAAVEAALREQATAWWQTPPRLDLAAEYAVEAHRRAVLDQRDDGERWATLAELAEKAPSGVLAAEGAALLAALADETIARRQAEVDRDMLARLRDEALDKATDYADEMRRFEDMASALLAEREGLPEWRCPDCGAVTRARMADHEGGGNTQWG